MPILGMISVFNSSRHGRSNVHIEQAFAKLYRNEKNIQTVSLMLKNYKMAHPT